MPDNAKIRPEVDMGDAVLLVTVLKDITTNGDLNPDPAYRAAIMAPLQRILVAVTREAQKEGLAL
jgi:hypothetical protein